VILPQVLYAPMRERKPILRLSSGQVLLVKHTAKVVWGILLLVLLSGCAGASQPPTGQRVLNVGMILARGGLGERSFNDSAYEGLQEAQRQFGIRFETADFTSDEANLEALRGLARPAGFRGRSIIRACQPRFANYALSPRLGGGPCKMVLDIRRPRGRWL